MDMINGKINISDSADNASGSEYLKGMIEYKKEIKDKNSNLGSQ